MFKDVQGYSKTFKDIQKRSRIFKNVQGCSSHVHVKSYSICSILQHLRDCLDTSVQVQAYIPKLKNILPKFTQRLVVLEQCCVQVVRVAFWILGKDQAKVEN